MKLKNLLNTTYWCLKLSWQASKPYTLIRLLIGIITPAFAIASAYLGRNIINLLAGTTAVPVPDQQGALLYLLLALLLISILRMMSQRATMYCQSMHGEIMQSRISLMLIER